VVEEVNESFLGIIILEMIRRKVGVTMRISLACGSLKILRGDED
jgi:hypothetical protein